MSLKTFLGRREAHSTTEVRSSGDPTAAGASLLVPGLGQLVRGRRTAAVCFFLGTVGLTAVGVVAPHLHTLVWTVAGFVSVWASVDAWRSGKRPPRDGT